MSAAICTPDEFASQALGDIAAKMEQVLSLQQQTVQHVAELRTGQAATQSTLADLLSQSVGRHLETPTGSKTTTDAPGICSTGSYASEAASTSIVSKPMLKFSKSVIDPGESFGPMSMSGAAPHSSSRRLRRMGPALSGPAKLLRVLDMVEDVAADSELDQAELQQTLDDLMGMGHCSSLVSSREHRGPRCIMEPHCKARISHDLMSILVLSYDMIVGLTVMAWDFEVQGVLSLLSILSFVFWSFDICMTFFTGYYVEGEFEARPRKVATKYLKSWFTVDIAIVGTDFFSLLLSDMATGPNEKGTDLLRISKASRFLRLLRVVRLARVSDSVARLMESNAYIETFVETLKPLLGIMVMNHVLACAWWSVSNYLPSDTNLRWIHEQVSSEAEMSFVDGSFWLQYWTCMHWSLTQLAVGSMDVAPRNSFERAFNCFSLVLGMLVFSTLISTISAMMMQHYLKQKDQLTKFAALRRFFRGRVKPSTAVAAQFQAHRSVFGNIGKPVTMDDLDAIDMIPHALQRSIRVELCEKSLQHPLFRWLFIIDAKGAEALCQHAIRFAGLAAEETLFFPRAEAAGAYAMISGDASYHLEGMPRLENWAGVVGQGRFFSEVALWCTWKHVGELIANKPCELLMIRTSGMIKCLDHVMVVKHVLVQYGRNFYEHLKQSLSSSDRAEDPNDLEVPCTDFASILLSLPAECQKLIGAVAADVKRRKVGWRDIRDDITAEVLAGKACLMLNWQGDVERIVSVIVLKLQHPDGDGRLLARVGSLNEDGVRAKCEFPGCKQKGGETTDDAYERFLRGVFAALAPHMKCTGTETEETWKESDRMLVKTKYLKTVTYAMLTCPVEHLDLESTQIMSVARSRVTVERTSGVSASWAVQRRGSTNSLMLTSDMDIFVLADGAGGITFVSWMSPEDMRTLSSPAAEAHLRRILEASIVSSEVLDVAKARFVAATRHTQQSDTKDMMEPYQTESVADW